jgi:hypothetical protein
MAKAAAKQRRWSFYKAIKALTIEMEKIYGRDPG